MNRRRLGIAVSVAALIILAVIGLVAFVSSQRDSDDQDVNSGSLSVPAASSLSQATPAAPALPKPEKTFPPVKGRVDLRDYDKNQDENCKDEDEPEEHCWLPTQHDPVIRVGETITLRDEWPRQDDGVEVACTSFGEEYRDGDGRTRVDWFGLLVPKDKIDSNPVPPNSPNLGRMPTSINGQLLVFVQAAWIVREPGKLHDCTQIV
jgi:hypothetical protein